MIFQDRGKVRYYQFESFDNSTCQAIFTRRGGVSPEPWATLNMGGTVGDDLQRVNENRQRGLADLGRDPVTVFDVWQVHGVETVIARSPHVPGTPHQQADAIITDQPGLTLMMRFADCVPVFLHDPVHKIIGIAHAGWLGTVRGIIPATLEAIKTNFGSNPADIIAGIGPSIGPDHYEVGAEVVTQVQKTFGVDASSLLVKEGEHTFFDLWAANRMQLEAAGINHIEISGLCTACHTEDWFSHRAEHGQTGRFGAIFALR
jgi:purine-nucleoside/S-methyl-5'-thioadenosine phosphorylase / adenosine deaminase